MEALRRDPLEHAPRLPRRSARHDGERQIARLPRVLSSAELAECCCPDQCLVDHDN